MLSRRRQTVSNYNLCIGNYNKVYKNGAYNENAVRIGHAIDIFVIFCKRSLPLVCTGTLSQITRNYFIAEARTYIYTKSIQYFVLYQFPKTSCRPHLFEPLPKTLQQTRN